MDVVNLHYRFFDEFVITCNTNIVTLDIASKSTVSWDFPHTKFYCRSTIHISLQQQRNQVAPYDI